ncbi:hypothetical protein DYB35_012343, partial [Aphanomyces astaci]
MYITRERRTTTAYDSMPPILAELKLDDERQKLHDPNLAKRANTMDDALNVGPDDCHYCGKNGHYKADCRRRSTDREKGIYRQNVRQPPRTNGGRGGSRGRGRGRNGWGRHDDSNYVKADDDEDLFMVQEISIAQADGDMKPHRHETDRDKSGGPMELEDEIDEVTADLANYATMLSDNDDECNNVLSSKAEVIVDSGATCHMTGDETILHDAIACKRGVRLADGHPISVTTMGDVRMKSRGTGRTVVFRNVLLVPSLTKTLISISRITDSTDAASILFKKDYCNIRSRTHLSIVGKCNAARMYAVHGDVIKPRPAADQTNSAEVAEPMLWHARCGHCLFVGYNETKKAYKVYDLEDEKVVYSVDITFHENEFLRPKAVLADADGVQVTKTEGQPADDQPLADDGDDDMGQEQPPRTPAQNTPKSHPLATPCGQRQPPPTPYARYPPRVLFRDDPPTEAAEDEVNPLPQAANTIRTGRENTKARTAAQTQIREATNETMQNVRRSARISELTQRRHQVVAAPETKPPFHPTRATARPHDADSPYMEAPAKTMRTTADRGITTREYEDNAALAYEVCMNVAD